ncbi:uncharacterized protein LOC105430562 [Pogonomyrmex barbatus]|uniref:Uncharacterized protein LOC105430562 n=1 Tax=Pogonomyrmex barbatus TaxID=144034 RepID=A0A6I9XC60_9HYME|nr:uncharacterized protein LOC105430562 [Pogonomyrmex barbatus]
MDNNDMNLHDIKDTIELDKDKKTKESLILLKQKMCKTNHLIQEYVKNVKEINHLRSDLETAKKEAKHMITNYQSAMDKIRELELKIVEDKQRDKKLKDKINEYEINTAADKQNIEQLKCKIKDLEEQQSIKDMEYNLQKSSFEDQIKDLEHELKKSKIIQKKKFHKKVPIDFDTAKSSIGTKSTSDIGINVSFDDNKPLIDTKSTSDIGINVSFDDNKPLIDTKSTSDIGINVSFDDSEPLIGTKSTSDIGINVSFDDNEPSIRCEIQDKNIMTEEFYNIKDDPYPLFCAKCETHLSPAVALEKICKTMSICPELIDNNLFPLSKKNDSSCLLSSKYPINNQSSNISLTPAFAENRNSTKQDFCSNNILTEHSSSIKKMERKLQSLESKIKKLRKLKEKRSKKRNSCCHCIGNYNNTSINSNLISIICKGIAEYYDNKEKTCSKNQNVDLEKCDYSPEKLKLKQKPSNKCNVHEETLWKIDNLNDKCQQNTFSGDATTATDILQPECILSKNCSFSNINILGTSSNDTDEFDKRDFVDEESTMHSAEMASVEDDLITSRLNTDEICVNVNCVNDFLSKDNVKIASIDDQTDTGISLSNDENTTDHTDNKIDNVNVEKNKMKRKSQNKDKIGDRLFKKIRNLKRKTRVNLCTNKQENIESCSKNNSEYNESAKRQRFEKKEKSDNHLLQNIKNLKRKSETQSESISKQENIESCSVNYEPTKKLRIAHIPKTLVPQLHISNEDISTHRTIKTIGSVETILRKSNGYQRLGARIQEDNLLLKSIKSHTINKICDEKNAVKSITTNNIDRPAKEQNVDWTSVKDCLQSNNITLSATGTECISEFEKSNNISTENTTNRNISMDKVTRKILNDNDNKSDVLHDKNNSILYNAVNGSQLEELIALRTTIESESNALSKDPNYEKSIETSKTIETKNDIIPISELKYTHEKLKNKSKEKMSKNVISNNELISDLSTVKVTQHESYNDDISDKTNEILQSLAPLQSSLSPSPSSLPSASLVSPSSASSPLLPPPLSPSPPPLSLPSSPPSSLSSPPLAASPSLSPVSLLPLSISPLPLSSPTSPLPPPPSPPLVSLSSLPSLPTSLSPSSLPLSSSLPPISSLPRSISPSPLLSLTSPSPASPLSPSTLASPLSPPVSSSLIPISPPSSLSISPSRLPQLLPSPLFSSISLSPLSSSSNNSIVESNTNDNVTKKSLNNLQNSINKREETYMYTKATGKQIIKTRKSNKITQILHSSSSGYNSTIEDYTINDNNMKGFLNKIENARNQQEETCISKEAIKVQAIEMQKNNAYMKQQDENMKFTSNLHYIKESQTPMSQLIKYINQKCNKKHKLPHKKILSISNITDKFVKIQLQKLVNSTWEDSIFDDVIQKLGNTCGPRIIAKCIVNFLLDNVDDDEPLDRSFTPPAPMMTTFEQKLIVLLLDLEVLKPTVIYFMQAAIEYHLFRLNNTVKTQVNSLTRIYVILARIQKDREKIRMMCCNALYSMGLKSMNVLYTALTCWPEVLPNAETNNGILPKCVAFLIGTKHFEYVSNDVISSAKKLNTLKSLISRYHKYNYTEQTINDIIKELMTILKVKRIDGLDTAIILIAKRKGPDWTYKNIIKSVLLPMIIKYEHPCIYSAFSLLGRLLRAFPLTDENNIVKDISEQLRDLIQSGQGSYDQQEGIISALISLSRHTFDIIAPCVIKWTPSKSLRSTTDMQLQAFINSRNSKFWKAYLKQEQLLIN